MSVLSSCRPASRWILLSLLGLLPTAAGLTQTPIPSFGTEGKSQFPETAVGIRGLGIGDFDRDGRLDVFGASERSTSFTYFGDGHADFRKTRVTVRNGMLTQAVLVADLNGDKILDLVMATANDGQSTTGQTRLLLGDGRGNFVDRTAGNLPKDSETTHDLAVGDVDGDGYLDLVLANGSLDGKKGQQNRLYLNNGKGGFTDATKALMPIDADLSQSVVLGDIDRDGDLDLIFGNGQPWLNAKGQTNKIYMNTGKGKFVTASSIWQFRHREVTNDLLLVDLDGDSDLDLIEANGDMIRGAQNRVYLNGGPTKGFLELKGSIPIEASFSTSLAVSDLNADGRLDLYVGNFRSPDRILLGNGRGVFSHPASPMITEDGNGTLCVAIRDLDADGNPDILAGNMGEGLRLILGLGKGLFLETTTGRFQASPKSGIQATALIDVDGDGNLDRVEAVNGLFGGQNELWLGDGRGGFANRTASHFPKDRDISIDVVGADIDGDGDLDLAFANVGQNSLYLNDGKGHFKDITASNLPKKQANTRALAFGDVDGDKDMDLLIANTNAANLLLLNDGKGRFSVASAFPKDTDETQDLKLADLDGDGDLDLVLVNGRHRMTGSLGQQNRLYLNMGKGRFMDVTTTTMPKLSDASSGVDAADVDGDGDVDLLVGNTDWNPTKGRRNVLLLNNGKAHFTDGTQGRLPPDLDNTWSVTFADFDLDGDADILMLNFSLRTITTGKARAYLENNGKGIFTDKTNLRIGLPWSLTPLPAVADVDRDGDIDVVFGRRVYKNRFQQIHAPRLARLGQTYEVLFFAETAYGRMPRLAFPLLSLSALQRPVRISPLGWLFLSPAQLYVGAPFTVPNDQAYRYRFPLPRQPALIGLTIHTQGLFLHGTTAASARLGNWIRDRILR